MAGLQPHPRLGQHRAVDAGATMDMFGGDQVSHERPSGARKYTRPGLAGQFANLQRIRLRLRQRHVAGDRGDRQNFEFIARQRQQDGDGIVLAEIAVDDDLLANHGTPCP